MHLFGCVLQPLVKFEDMEHLLLADDAKTDDVIAPSASTDVTAAVWVAKSRIVSVVKFLVVAVHLLDKTDNGNVCLNWDDSKMLNRAHHRQLSYPALLRQGKQEFAAASDRLKDILKETALALLNDKKLTKNVAEKYYISSEFYNAHVQQWNTLFSCVHFHNSHANTVIHIDESFNALLLWHN